MNDPVTKQMTGWKVAGLLLLLISARSFSQSCNCPATTACNACLDGITSLTLKYNGATTAHIKALDLMDVRFEKDVAPAETFTVTGSDVNGKFTGNNVTLLVDGNINVVITTNCTDPVYVNSVYGDFTVIAGMSKSGGPVCCAPGMGDTEAPVITGCPSNPITITAAGGCQVTVSWTSPEASDNCSAVILVSTHNPGDVFPLGTTTVTYTATDDNNNTSECSFDVIVKNDDPPVITGCPTKITVDAATGRCDASVTWTPPQASSICSAANLTSTHSPGDVFPVGTTTVTYTATDVNNNKTVTCSFDVVVENKNKPILSGCPRDMYVVADDNGEATVNWSPPTASGPCDGITLSGNHNPGEIFFIGTSPVEYTATDNDGNESRCTFDVVVSSKEEINFDITKIITPDGDSIQDQWMMPGIENYQDNNVMIVDRWGNMVYRASGYNNAEVMWNGRNRQGELVPTGTYFYTIAVRVLNAHVEKRGFIELIR